MAVEIGEAREQWGRDVWAQAEKFADAMKSEVRPFYIVYAAKQDRYNAHVFRQTMKAYYSRPAAMLGLLVWYVDNAQGIFQFVPELSAPPDMPLDPSLLSTASEDASPRVMAQGQRLHALQS
jgi:hypothetical protein